MAGGDLTRMIHAWQAKRIQRNTQRRQQGLKVALDAVDAEQLEQTTLLMRN